VTNILFSFVLIPGTSLLPRGLLGVAYLVFLGYLFLGISIIADIFMEAIEVITSQTKTVSVYDEKNNTEYYIETPIWNATIANLTLMALGSSAPEILLSVIGTVTTLDQPAPSLGAATIVGSAAFNLLVISAVSIVAVEEPKRIFDMGVFATTSLFSLFAYIWLFLCLSVNTPDIVTKSEAWLTLIFFFILVMLAFMADKYNEYLISKEQTEGDLLLKQREDEKKHKKNLLRHYAKQHGQGTIIEIAQGLKSPDKKIKESEQREIRDLFLDVLETKDISDYSIKELVKVLEPDTLLERFAARKENKVGANKDFIEIKGVKGQIENTGAKVENANDIIGFKCLHYSVTESSGHVTLTIVKKNTS
jgi:Ca2+/Na+ antiporter